MRSSFCVGVFIIAFSFSSFSQSEALVPGVHFETGLNWDQLVQEARAENKFIFLDCYASWCGPCKEMDKSVYPKERVGDFMNARFLSVRVQLDSTVKDDGEVQKWYGDAHWLSVNYKIKAFPTFLFFSPEGKIVHRYTGFMPDTVLIREAGNALNPEKQFYTLLTQYKNGTRDYSKVPYLTGVEYAIREEGSADSMAIDYFNHWLTTVPIQEWYQPVYHDYIFTYSNVLRSDGPLFRYLFDSAGKIDAVMQMSGFSKKWIDQVVWMEEIYPLLEHSSTTETEEWKKVQKRIRERYRGYDGSALVLSGEIYWAKDRKNWDLYSRCVVEEMDKYGPGSSSMDSMVNLNNNAFMIFLHTDNRKYLKAALSWVTLDIQIEKGTDARSIDTKANILYKLGEKDMAIACEEDAEKVELEHAEKHHRKPDPIYRNTIEKMKAGSPTW